MSDTDSKEKIDLLQSSSSSKISSENGHSNNKLTPQLIFATVVTVLGSSFQFGYNTGVINNAQFVLKAFINESYYSIHELYPTSAQINVNYSIMVSIFAIGGMIGSFTVGYFADRYGRKRTMLANNALVVVAVGFVVMAHLLEVYYLLIVARLFFGFNCGFNTGLAPMYLTEIAPIQLRGAFGTLNQMGIVSAILVSQILGLQQVFGNEKYWILLLCAPLAFAAIQTLCLPFCPETPAYLVSKRDTVQAYVALRWLRGCDDVEVDMSDIQAQNERHQDLVTITHLFVRPALRRALVVAVVMQLSQQLSGINAVFYYSADMFYAAGVSEAQSNLVTMGVGLVNVVMCAISVPLMEKVGRRPLHLIGLGGMTVCAVILTATLELSLTHFWAANVTVVAVMLFVVFFQSGPGSIPWFITAEIFNQSARPAAVSVAGLVNWTGNFIVGIGYLPLKDLIGGYTFAVFSVLLILFWLFTYFRVPETRGRGIDEIAASFQNSDSTDI